MTKQIHRAYLSLGSNIDPEKNLRSALEALRKHFGHLLVSPIYRTPAIGFTGADFLNLAAGIDTELDPEALNTWLHQLEDQHGRRRDVPRFHDRPLDIDIVFFDDYVMQAPGHLEIPRPELQHAFVLKPLVDIAPDYPLPTDGRTLSELWATHPENGSLQWRAPYCHSENL